MTFPLPPVVADYLAAAARGDTDAIVACFTDDAVVHDEDHDWHGHEGVREWRETVAKVYTYTVEVRGVAALGERDALEYHEVHTHLEGNFPGGTVELANRFGLRGGRIARLEIVPWDTG